MSLLIFERFLQDQIYKIVDNILPKLLVGPVTESVTALSKGKCGALFVDLSKVFDPYRIICC